MPCNSESFYLTPCYSVSFRGQSISGAGGYLFGVLHGREVGLFAEDFLEVGAAAESAVLGDDVVRPVGMLPQQALGLLDAVVGEPGVEEFLLGGLQP